MLGAASAMPRKAVEAWLDSCRSGDRKAYFRNALAAVAAAVLVAPSSPLWPKALSMAELQRMTPEAKHISQSRP